MRRIFNTVTRMFFITTNFTIFFGVFYYENPLNEEYKYTYFYILFMSILLFPCKKWRGNSLYIII